MHLAQRTVPFSTLNKSTQPRPRPRPRPAPAPAPPRPRPRPRKRFHFRGEPSGSASAKSRAVVDIVQRHRIVKQCLDPGSPNLGFTPLSAWRGEIVWGLRRCLQWAGFQTFEKCNFKTLKIYRNSQKNSEKLCGWGFWCFRGGRSGGRRAYALDFCVWAA